jgi:hypothetical protein
MGKISNNVNKIDMETKRLLNYELPMYRKYNSLHFAQLCYGENISRLKDNNNNK